MQTVLTQNMNHRGSVGRRLSLVLGATFLALATSSQANMVTDWNSYLETAVKTANVASPIPQIRGAAIVHAAIFDAVNGIARDYTPLLVSDSAPGGARQEAAVALAGYTTLLALYPAQKATLDAQLAASLAPIPGHQGKSQSIARGMAWGQAVANAILAWRANDGFNTTPPPFFGSTTIPGVWRSIPNGTLPGVFPQVATMVPFAMTSHNQFRPGPPPALTSAEYTAAVNEVKALGAATGSTRTDEQTLIAGFWNALDLADERRAATALIPDGASLVDTARFYALISIAAADGLIAGMDSKYTYALWRPYHAIRLADTDGNPNTTPDPNWTPLLTTPNHPEYISNHAVVTGAFMHMLASLVGNDNSLTITTPGLPGVERSFAQISDAVDEVKVARIYAGFHYRFSVNTGEEVGAQIADYVLANALLPARGNGHHH
jgi:hypothetical protein